MPKKLFIETTFSYENDDFLQITGKMNSNIVQIKIIFKTMKIVHHFISPEYGIPSKDNNNEFFHILKGK